MRHVLTDDMVQQLVRRHEADLERTRKMYSTPWRVYTSASHFESVTPVRDRFLAWIVGGVIAWLILCFSVGGLIRLFEAVRAPQPRPIAPEAYRSDYGSLR